MPDEIVDAERPVFVLGCAYRCGSTLLQRALSTSHALHVWGENHGMVEDLARAAGRLVRQDRAVANATREFEERGLDGFIANLNPPVASVFGAAPRAWLCAFYDGPTRALGKTRWGFKEVRHDAALARFLLEVFPAGRVLFLLRDPVSVVASMSAAPWYRAAGGARGVLSAWRRQTDSFLLCGDARARIVRHEALVADPAREMALIARHVGLPEDGFDLRVFSKVVRGVGGTPRIEAREALELRSRSLRDAARRAGYPDPALDPRAALGPALVDQLRRLLTRPLRTPADPGPR